MLRNLLRVGFWFSPIEPRLPHPRTLVDPAWDGAERFAVIRHLRHGREHEVYCGSSYCRLHETDSCTKYASFGLGSKEFTDGTYVWPESLIHYLVVHHVKPDAAFVKHVLTQARRTRR